MAVVRYETGRIKKGDTVVVLAGKNKGKQGQVMRIDPQEGSASRGAGQHHQEAHRSPRRPRRAASWRKRRASMHLERGAASAPSARRACAIGYKSARRRRAR
ncbi:MAG: KOW motif-containing protein [Desulfomicrobium escambiense]|nr:KOW motif-containing protein [Desulfomicrobium escambiense]